MFIKVFEGSDVKKLESEVNDFIESDETEDYVLHSLLQSESMVVFEGKLQKHITMTCIYVEQIFQDLDEDDDF
ncbi:MAG: hypothetical protein IEMM0008_0260 [bacterium]|nr:MAG: hypothetical protein IEMM0008_0260 [bacterium]